MALFFITYKKPHLGKSVGVQYTDETLKFVVDLFFIDQRDYIIP
ncbi:hypothetical protein SAMN05444584_0654 [Acinetobacter apis]|uniref:Uncharacterized protein n=1 Tax=Acinetobacter apis TaxID=1229165 RepID=A0A217EDY9_9GAMM|nr:hypothetical protein SAMN05444584_0654 [Acinetobacter apis]